MLIKLGFHIGDPLALMQNLRFASEAAFADADMIIELHLQRGAPFIIRQQAGECAAHGAIGQAISDPAVRGMLGAEMLLGVDINRHGAAAIAALDHLQAERAGKSEIRLVASQRTRGPPKGAGGGGRRVPRGNCA